MPIIYTENLAPSEGSRQVYNGLDCCITSEVLGALQQQFNQSPIIYDFERALQAPALEMMLRGFRVDNIKRLDMIGSLQLRLSKLQNILDRYAYAVWDKPLNPNSPKQLIDFFYHKMKLPEQFSHKKGQTKLSTDREALEALELYFYARPIVACILAIRDLKKQLSVLETEIDSDMRMRTSYNIAGTETGRWSSSSSAYGVGTNLQNIARDLRIIFVSDPGMKLYGIDLEQAESREVGWLSGTILGDWSYLDACLSGDLHTTVARMAYPNLAWTGDAKKDRAIAEQIVYRTYSYRDLSKKLGHGCVPADHEVLTPQGWVSIANKPSVIMAWDAKTQTSSWSDVSHWTDYIHSGPMYEIFGNSISLCATPDHRIPYTPDQRSAKFKVTTAEHKPKGYLPLGSGWIGGSVVVPAKLIAAFMADGHQSSNSSIRFHFHKERKFQRLEKLAQEYGYEYRRSGDKATILNCGILPKHPGSFMFDWTAQSLKDFMEELKHWDGHISSTAVSIHSALREDLEWYQTFGRLVGIGGSIQKPRLSGYGTVMHILQQNNRQYATANSLTHGAVYYTGLNVFCPTVTSGFFYVRRNGRVFVTGNSNYYGKPTTIARHAKIPVRDAEFFQSNYFAGFPGIPKWHRWTAQQIQTTHQIETVFGRRRHFFGRPNDDATLREAIAFAPQGATGDRMNLGLWRLWKHMGKEIQLLGQVHDAVYFQAPDLGSEYEADVIKRALALIEIPMTDPKSGRTYTVPGEAKTGWNWGDFNDDAKRGPLNPEGLKKFKGSDTRTRLEGLDRRM